MLDVFGPKYGHFLHRKSQVAKGGGGGEIRIQQYSIWQQRPLEPGSRMISAQIVVF